MTQDLSPMQKISRSVVVLVSALLAVVAAASPMHARAETTAYTSAWGGGVIAPGDTVRIDDGASITGNVEANGMLQFNQTTSLVMSSTLSGTGALSLTNTGTFTLTGLTSGTARWNLAISVDQGRLAIGSTGTNSLIIGSSGTGSLVVNGGYVTSGAGYLGNAVGSFGSASVASGTWSTSSRFLYVGSSGHGQLDVVGGTVADSSGVIGNAGGTGVVNVTSGAWTNSGPLYVGGTSAVAASGMLTVSGGLVRNTFGNIGFAAGNVGAVTVTGGTWANTVGLFVGRSGMGTLDIAGGLVTSVGGTIASGSGSIGTVTVSSGTWLNNGALAVGASGTGTLTISGSGGTGGVVIVGGTLSRGAFGTINLKNGGTLQIGTGTTSGSLATDLVNDGAIVFNRSGTSTMSSAISGTGSLAIVGAGVLTFSGTSDYSGSTSVTAGSLLVNGVLGPTAVSVHAGGLLGGTGVVGGPITIGSGGVISPGASIESLSTSVVTLLDGATFAYEINSTGPSAADLLSITGDLVLFGTVGLSITDLASSPAPFTEGTTFSLINYGGTWNGGLFSYAGTTLGEGSVFTMGQQRWLIDYDATSGGTNFTSEYLPESHFVNIVAVPEPSTIAMLVTALATGGYALGSFKRRASSARSRELAAAAKGHRRSISESAGMVSGEARRILRLVELSGGGAA